VPRPPPRESDPDEDGREQEPGDEEVDEADPGRREIEQTVDRDAREEVFQTEKDPLAENGDWPVRHSRSTSRRGSAGAVGVSTGGFVAGTEAFGVVAHPNVDVPEDRPVWRDLHDAIAVGVDDECVPVWQSVGVPWPL
jgi:hypothetical protein